MEKKILVVDNNPVILEFMANLLRKERHTVLTAEDGLSALDILDNFIPDVIFIDLIMPNIDGKRLCRIIRQMPRLEHVKIVILSGIAAEEKLDIASFKADAYLPKAPANKMKKHVLNVIERLPVWTSESAMELEYLSSREITKELLADKRHLELILSSMSEGILEITSEARIVLANPAAISLTGREERDLLASNFADLFSGEDRRKVDAMIDSLDSGPQTSCPGSPFSLSSRVIGMTILPVEGEDRKAIVIMNDLTEQKQKEEQLREAQKMKAVGILAAGVAHDFNNILMAIQGFVSLMLLKTDSRNPQIGMLHNIEQQIQNGSKLSKQLLGYARKGRYKVETVDLNKLIKQTANMFGRSHKEINVHLDLSQDLFKIEADQEQIEQVLFNMYMNAADAMPKGGDLFLHTENESHSQTSDRLNDPWPGRYVMLSIKDRGKGMDEETMEHIFEPFFTTKEMGMSKGTGLGLASVYGIVTGHQGHIDVVSEPAQGSTFTIYLPGKKETSREQISIEKSKGSTSSDRPTVLLVDDEDTIREVAQKLLEGMGYKVLTARNGKESIRIYKEHIDDINIVLLDMIMPIMGGGKTYDRLKQINPDVKAILLSGYTIDGEAGDILKRGCNDFIQKPFNIKELSQKIQNVLGN
ncbi:MAG: response regulator [Thermodesulfobacteriota bacterium]|nr:response regulator [Thermodesulfobacteriota bacterium]